MNLLCIYVQTVVRGKNTPFSPELNLCIECRSQILYCFFVNFFYLLSSTKPETNTKRNQLTYNFLLLGWWRCSSTLRYFQFVLTLIGEHDNIEIIIRDVR